MTFMTYHREYLPFGMGMYRPLLADEERDTKEDAIAYAQALAATLGPGYQVEVREINRPNGLEPQTVYVGFTTPTPEQVYDRTNHNPRLF